eukprot:3712217-Amphidinium_carterae.2
MYAHGRLISGGNELSRAPLSGPIRAIRSTTPHSAKGLPEVEPPHANGNMTASAAQLRQLRPS